jgi:hypothetical protein
MTDLTPFPQPTRSRGARDRFKRRCAGLQAKHPSMTRDDAVAQVMRMWVDETGEAPPKAWLEEPQRPSMTSRGSLTIPTEDPWKLAYGGDEVCPSCHWHLRGGYARGILVWDLPTWRV